jgi:DNA-directed RNA polymerase specialized sigma24 family protein
LPGVERERGLFVIGDAIGSKRDSAGTADWLRALATDLNAALGEWRRAEFAFTRGDEIRGLLRPDADPMLVVLHTALADSIRPIRWGIAWGEMDAAPADATAADLAGPAVTLAEAATAEAKHRHERLVLRTGDAEADALLDGMSPALMGMLDELTQTQRHVARLAIIDGLRQSEVAERLKVRRATISVSFARSRVSSLEALAGAIGTVCAGAAAAKGKPSGEGPAPGAGLIGRP